ncbi:secreted protein [Beggiatoa sp. PS]|nr:secreted protein [Beggiatoa sp. PS]
MVAVAAMAVAAMVAPTMVAPTMVVATIVTAATTELLEQSNSVPQWMVPAA